jgi:two-component system response regulator MprA
MRAAENLERALAREQERRRVLVVEDDESIRTALCRGLQLSGYEVTGANDGYDALDEIQRQPPALVVLDMLLPRLNGIEVVHELQRRGVRPGLPILAISAEQEAGETAATVGVEGFLPKPLRLPVVLSEVARLSGSRPGRPAESVC